MQVLEINGVKIEWLGHASFRVSGRSVVIYTDPYVLDANPPKADIILVSHEHFDHNDSIAIQRISKDNTMIVGPESVTHAYVDAETVVPGSQVEVKGVMIKSIPAYNPAKPFHPKEKGHVGFIFEVDGVKIYHAGDTDLIPEMEELAQESIDVAFLPIGGTYVMDEEQAARAANIIKPKYVVPMHYGKWRDIELEADVEKFRNLVSREIRVMVLDGIGRA